MGRPVGSKNLQYKTHCKQGHKQGPNSRYESTGGCKECTIERARQHALDYPEETRAAAKEYYKTHTEEAKLYAKVKMKHLKRSGWNVESFAQTLVKQNSCCAVCTLPFTEENPPCADHEHTIPPKPRGLLHRRCNSALGMFNDSPEVCEMAAAYIRKWKEAQNA